MPQTQTRTRTQTSRQLHSVKLTGKKFTEHERNTGVTDAQQHEFYWQVQEAGQKALGAETKYKIAVEQNVGLNLQLQGATLDTKKVYLQNVGKGIDNRTEQAKNAGKIVDLGSAIDAVKFKVVNRTMTQHSYVEQLRSTDLSIAQQRRTNDNTEAEIKQQGLMGQRTNPTPGFKTPSRVTLDRLMVGVAEHDFAGQGVRANSRSARA